MKFIDDFKNKAGAKKIQKDIKAQSKNRVVNICNLNQAKTLGVIYDVNNESDYIKIIKLVKYLKGEFGLRKVKVISFYAEKEEPNFMQSKLEFDFFTKKDLSWKMIPTSTVVDNFTKEKFDILIDFTEKYVTPLRHVLVQSKSAFKVGRFSKPNEPFYDLMIEEKDPSDFEAFVNHLVQYLTMINPA